MSCDDLWLNICQKLDECDEKMKNMNGVTFFFSSVAALERRSKEKKEKADSQEQEDDQINELPEKYWPAITYWIAVQSCNGLRISTVPLHSTLLETGMEVIAKALPVCKRGSEEESCAPLCNTLKDHNNHFMQTKAEMSFSHSLQLLQDQLVEEPLDSLHASERVVRLQVNGGWCFSISQRKFVLHPIKSTEIGKESPRIASTSKKWRTFANITFDSSTAAKNNTKKG